jgi:hypothetical protein
MDKAVGFAEIPSEMSILASVSAGLLDCFYIKCSVTIINCSTCIIFLQAVKNEVHVVVSGRMLVVSSHVVSAHM